jgi:glycosyltransferase involved in cell wall biosynthesis
MESLNNALARLLWKQKRRWVHRSAKMATLVTVQTAALADAISSEIALPRSQITVIPHGPGLAEHLCSPPNARKVDEFRIGYITKWGVQKNFETLLKAARRLRDENYNFRLVLTLDERSPETAEVMAAARRLSVVDLIENHGEVASESIPALYDSLDLFVFASFCESFGFPTVEAMARGLPLIVASTPENKEVTRGAALEFSPLAADELAVHLATLMNDENERTKRGRLSLTESRHFSWHKAARQTIAALESIG